MFALILSSISAEAQIRKGRFDQFTVDTLTDAGTLTWDTGREITDYDPIDFTWHITADSLSGTTDVTIYIQESLNPAGGDWVNVDTISISADGYNAFTSGTVTGARQRLSIVGAGTQSTSLKAWVRYRKKEF
jgi:hypothetical protein